MASLTAATSTSTHGEESSTEEEEEATEATLYEYENENGDENGDGDGDGDGDEAGEEQEVKGGYGYGYGGYTTYGTAVNIADAQAAAAAQDAADKGAWVMESGVPLSQSRLWALQRGFYDQKGIQAWTEGIVPDFITTNTHIARSYARMVLGYVEDCLCLSNTHPEQMCVDLSEPFYILELGSGSGKFCHYVLRALEAQLHLMPHLAQAGVSLCFILTDFTESNVSFFEQHEQLRPYFHRGQLDCALFDIQQPDKPIYLRHSRKTIIPWRQQQQQHKGRGGGGVANPLIVFANYLFCVVEQDAFRLDSSAGKGVLTEALTTTRVLPRKSEHHHPTHAQTHGVEAMLLAADGTGKTDPSAISRSRLQFDYSPVPDPHARYGTHNHPLDGPYMAPLLAWYTTEYNRTLRWNNDTQTGRQADRQTQTKRQTPVVDWNTDEPLSFMLPVGAIRALGAILNLCRQGQMLLLCSDKGWNHADELQDRQGYVMSVEGSFSFMVNLHAIGKWFELSGGAAFRSDHRIDEQGDTCLSTLVATTGLPASCLHGLRRAFTENITDFGPCDIYHICHAISDRVAIESKPIHYHRKRSIVVHPSESEADSQDWTSAGTYRRAATSQSAPQHKEGKLSLQKLLSHWKLTCYDPYFFEVIKPILLPLLADTYVEREKHRVATALEATWQNYYHIPGSPEDPAFEIGRCYYQMQTYGTSSRRRHARALYFYNESLRLYGPHHITLYNIGLCLQESGNIKEAKVFYEKTLAADPTYTVARTALNIVEGLLKESNKQTLLYASGSSE